MKFKPHKLSKEKDKFIQTIYISRATEKKLSIIAKKYSLSKAKLVRQMIDFCLENYVGF